MCQLAFNHCNTFSLMWSSATSIAMPKATLQSTPAVLYTRRLGVRYSSRRHLEEVGRREGGREGQRAATI